MSSKLLGKQSGVAAQEDRHRRDVFSGLSAGLTSQWLTVTRDSDSDSESRVLRRPRARRPALDVTGEITGERFENFAYVDADRDPFRPYPTDYCIQMSKLYIF
jgi:hypothetical protein